MTSRLTRAKLTHMSKPSISSGEAAKALGISRMTLLRWLHRGLVSAAWVTPAGQFRWNLDDLERQLDADRPANNVTRQTAPDLRGYQPALTPIPDPDQPQQPAVIAAAATSPLAAPPDRRRD